MTKLELNYAYPFMSLAYVLVFIMSVILLQESITIYKIVDFH